MSVYAKLVWRKHGERVHASVQQYVTDDVDDVTALLHFRHPMSARRCRVAVDDGISGMIREPEANSVESCNRQNKRGESYSVKDGHTNRACQRQV
ncbi:hypothetical protein LSAT2_013837 [Lamellibrachia satsuma]|nr:hypothetical protein LSAT2_013837 [Lamellibrachia satsuma]